MKKILSILAVIVVIVSLAVPAFAYDYNGEDYSLDYYTKDSNGEWQYAGNLQDLIFNEGGYLYFMNQSGSPYMYYMDSPLYVKNNELYHTDATTYYILSWNNSLGAWMLNNTSPQNGNANGRYGFANILVWTSSNVMDGDSVYMSGDSNFQLPPLAEMVLKVTEEEMVEVTIPNLLGVLKILVPCGVGCLALLVGLKLFGKKSLISRN